MRNFIDYLEKKNKYTQTQIDNCVKLYNDSVKMFNILSYISSILSKEEKCVLIKLFDKKYFFKFDISQGMFESEYTKITENNFSDNIAIMELINYLKQKGKKNHITLVKNKIKFIVHLR